MALAATPRKRLEYIVVLCSDCKKVPLTAQPKTGVAKDWEKLLICDDCAAKALAKLKAQWSFVKMAKAAEKP